MLEKLQEIVRRFTDDENIVITVDSVLLTDLGLNSYELVQMICAVEDEFDVEIPDRAIGSFKIANDVLGYIATHK